MIGRKSAQPYLHEDSGYLVHRSVDGAPLQRADALIKEGGGREADDRPPL